MERCGVDQLHLVFLNMFKHLFKYTVHEGLPTSRKKLVSNYLKAAGFYSYDAASVDEDPTAHWIGREVKRFLNEADKHVLFLLQIASAPADVCEKMALNERGRRGRRVRRRVRADGGGARAGGEGGAANDAERGALGQLPRARAVHPRAVAAPQGEADTTAYREGRAVEAFNLAAK
eukprot:1488285-Prymnesium_polylepis.1